MLFNWPKKVIALRDCDDGSLDQAASGGAFSVLARPILAEGGVVFGARSFEGGRVSHCCIEDEKDIGLLQGSVYAQSDMDGVYKCCAQKMTSGKKVLFVGTPCQCAALVSYLEAGKIITSLAECKELFVCDLVCHGVPNQALFEAHQKWLAHKNKADDGIHSFKFRSKRNGWGLYYCYYYYKNGKRVEVCDHGDSDPYYAAFLRGEIYRTSCYKCPFARTERVTDFTIGDYWGIESAHPEFYDSRGVSLVLVNTEKADSYFSGSCENECEWLESNIGLAVKENCNLKRPTIEPSSRQTLMRAISAYRSNGDIKLLFDNELKRKRSVKLLVKKLLPASAFRILKRAKRSLG